MTATPTSREQSLAPPPPSLPALMPCPFCWAVPGPPQLVSSAPECWCITCIGVTCDVMPCATGESAAAAARAWNHRRHPEPCRPQVITGTLTPLDMLESGDLTIRHLGRGQFAVALHTGGRGRIDLVQADGTRIELAVVDDERCAVVAHVDPASPCLPPRIRDLSKHPLETGRPLPPMPASAYPADSHPLPLCRLGQGDYARDVNSLAELLDHDDLQAALTARSLRVECPECRKMVDFRQPDNSDPWAVLKCPACGAGWDYDESDDVTDCEPPLAGARG